MQLQYLTDSKGKYTGIFIPIKEWEKLKARFPELEDEENDIPDWQKKILDERLADYESNPEQVLDFDSLIDEIEKNT
jgi:hypothetical protein